MNQRPSLNNFKPILLMIGDDYDRQHEDKSTNRSPAAKDCKSQGYFQPQDCCKTQQPVAISRGVNHGSATRQNRTATTTNLKRKEPEYEIEPTQSCVDTILRETCP